jgi:type IV pilus assembly protein PilY1
MSTSSRPRSMFGGLLGKLLYTSLSVWMLGVVYTPALAATVTVDQAPLIIQKSLPPNVTLMLDDSGSMAWDYMPDWGYLNNNSNNNAVIDASNNGTYYNSTVTYSPPPNADGTSHTAATSLTSAWADGFKTSTGSADLTAYNGSTYDSGNIDYSPYTTNAASYSNVSQTTCNTKYNNSVDASNLNFTGNSRTNGTCTYNYRTYLGFFQYSTGPAAGPYVVHYVASSSCGSLTSTSTPISCVLASDTSGAAAPSGVVAGQNIANWFSYYHTRILMAKSGLMNSFSSLDSTFRVGFGSINNTNSAGVTATGSYTNSYNSKYIAQVQPFGNGSSGTQKSNFWNWVTGINPNNSTPLRIALEAVGKYYSSTQPWMGMSSDPDYTTAAGSTELACRQSYTILTTDGFWNESYTGSGDVDGATGTAVTGPNGQSYTYTPALPYQDGGSTTSTTTMSFSQNGLTSAQCTASYNSAQSPSNYSYTAATSKKSSKCTYNYTQTTTSTVSYSDTLADVAMKYWETDLQTSVSNEVPTNAEDPAFWQHMTTFTLGLGFTPQYADGTNIPMDQVFAWANGDNSKAISGFTWPKPVGDSINNIADLAHAAVNGHGGFYSATSPQAFANGLKDALKRASERVGTGASLAANSTQLQTGTVAYQANYWTAKWKGDLKALAVNSTTGAIATAASWTASGSLPAAASRNIKTYNPTAAAGSQFVAFKVAADGTLPAISSAQLTALGGSSAAQTNMINYLRGDTSQEQRNSGSYRNRDTSIGDIVNSQPVYAGAPNPNQFTTESFTGSSGFAQYASDNANRAGAVYVAANDGMLHAFDAGSGAEKFAYLPGAVITAGVSALSSLDYGGTVAHSFFDDGELTVADAYIGSPVGWKTVLVGTTGRGVAETVYALDITDPANVKLLWERSAADGLTNSKYIGQMTGKPVIAQTANGTWSVLMGNGYNGANGVAALLQFNLADGTLNVHATTDTTGLAAPAVWMDPSGNGVSTMAYAGDASGNVWSFAINTSAGTSATATPNSNGVKLFTATDGTNPQPITAGMLAGKDPNTGNIWVFFGTGQYLTTADLLSKQVQSWYGLIVQSGTSGLAVTSTMTRAANLAQRSITDEVGNGRAVTTQTAAATITGKSGWYIDLKSPVNGAEGERMVTPNQFQGNLLLGTTRIPLASDSCNPSGRGWIMALDPFTGTNPSANFFDLNGDGKIDASDSVNGKPAAGIGFTSLPNNPIFVGSTMLTSFDNGSTSSIQTSNSTNGTQRVSWRELVTQ